MAPAPSSAQTQYWLEIFTVPGFGGVGSIKLNGTTGAAGRNGGAETTAEAVATLTNAPSAAARLTGVSRCVVGTMGENTDARSMVRSPASAAAASGCMP